MEKAIGLDIRIRNPLSRVLPDKDHRSIINPGKLACVLTYVYKCDGRLIHAIYIDPPLDPSCEFPQAFGGSRGACCARYHCM
jgi:hypothetical protein